MEQPPTDGIAFLDEQPALVVSAPAGLVLATNGAFREHSGYADNDLIGQPLRSLQPATVAGSLISALQAQQAGSGFSVHEVPLRLRDGRSVTGTFECRDRAGNWVLGDATETQLLESSDRSDDAAYGADGGEALAGGPKREATREIGRIVAKRVVVRRPLRLSRDDLFFLRSLMKSSAKPQKVQEWALRLFFVPFNQIFKRPLKHPLKKHKRTASKPKAVFFVLFVFACVLCVCVYVLEFVVVWCAYLCVFVLVFSHGVSSAFGWMSYL